MKLINLDSYQTAYKKSVIFFCVCVVSILIAFVISFFQLSKDVKSMAEQTQIIDTRGQVYPSTLVASKDVRVYEYQNHIRTFVNLFYAFDENTFRDNINKGLYLIGDQGKELHNQYIDLGVEKALLQKNLRYTVQITGINIDMEAMPISGEVTFIQTGHRRKGSIQREVGVKFTIYDVDKSDKNSNGAKIDQWEYFLDRIIENSKDKE